MTDSFVLALYTVSLATFVQAVSSFDADSLAKPEVLSARMTTHSHQHHQRKQTTMTSHHAHKSKPLDLPLNLIWMNLNTGVDNGGPPPNGPAKIFFVKIEGLSTMKLGPRSPSS